MNSFDILLSFLEGLALIASPCILPVLPLVLSTSIEGGKARPFGIIAGFIVSFSAFVLLSRKLVEAFHIDTDIIRNASLVLLAIMGLVLLIDKLSDKFSGLTQGAANFGTKFGAGGEGGFGSGLIIGALIGLVWTPCAGPILAAVLVQVIRQNTDLQSVLVTVGFALGASIPMFIIAMLGRKFMKKVGFLTQHAYAIRKIFGVLMLVSVIYLGFGGAIQSAVTPATDATAPAPIAATALQNPLDKPYPAPEFAGIQAWLNSNPLTMAQLRGKIVLIDFWTYSCINCVRTLPYVTAWDAKYRDQGLVIIGVHSPEFEFEKNIDNIKTALDQRGIHYPVAVDNNLATWVAFNNKFWPAHYLINRDGQVVYTHFGEGDYDVTENNIRYLLGFKDKIQINEMYPSLPTGEGQTQETYIGYGRADRFEGTQQHDKTTTYPAADLPLHHWTFNGAWKVEKQFATAEKTGASLRLHFKSKKVFLVLGTQDGQPQQVTLTLNGQPTDTLTVIGHTLYQLVDQPAAQDSTLEITATAPGLQAYAFTFGN